MSERLKPIDGLRALACIGVILHHGYVHAGKVDFPTIAAFGLPLSLSRLFSYGYFGVDLFLALSAFCLSYPYLVKGVELTDWKAYMKRRARRILPPYYAAWILLFIAEFAVPALIYHAGFPPIKKLISSFFLIEVMLNASFWTLCLEARWYFVFPLLLKLVRKVGWFWSLAVSLSASCAFLYLDSLGHSSSMAVKVVYYSKYVPFFLPTFAVGIFAAMLVVSARPWLSTARGVAVLRTMALATLVAMLWFVQPEQAYVMPRLLVGAAGSFSLILLALHDRRLMGVFSNATLVKIGVASYSIYLIHEPFIHLSYSVTKAMALAPAYSFVWYQMALPVALILVGYLFHVLFERPFLASKKPVTAVMELRSTSGQAQG